MGAGVGGGGGGQGNVSRYDGHDEGIFWDDLKRLFTAYKPNRSAVQLERTTNAPKDKLRLRLTSLHIKGHFCILL